MKEPRMTRLFYENVWPKNKIGYYVEIGAWDGRKKNSTIILERAGWKGTAIEPSPLSYAELIKNRKCNCLNVAVFNRDGEVDFALFPDRPEWNGIIQTFDELHTKLLTTPVIGDRVSRPPEIKKIPCNKWDSLNLPSTIDYMQLDVEGAELAILDCIDWSKQHISYICIEDNNSHNGEYKKYMEKLGYELLFNQHVDFLYFKK